MACGRLPLSPVQLRFYGRDGEASGEQVVNEMRVSDEQQ